MSRKLFIKSSFHQHTQSIREIPIMQKYFLNSVIHEILFVGLFSNSNEVLRIKFPDRRCFSREYSPVSLVFLVQILQLLFHGPLSRIVASVPPPSSAQHQIIRICWLLAALIQRSGQMPSSHTHVPAAANNFHHRYSSPITFSAFRILSFSRTFDENFLMKIICQKIIYF